MNYNAQEMHNKKIHAESSNVFAIANVKEELQWRTNASSTLEKGYFGWGKSYCSLFLGFYCLAFGASLLFQTALTQPKPDDLGYIDSESAEEIGSSRDIQMSPFSGIAIHQMMPGLPKRTSNSGKYLAALITIRISKIVIISWRSIEFGINSI